MRFNRVKSSMLRNESQPKKLLSVCGYDSVCSMFNEMKIRYILNTGGFIIKRGVCPLDHFTDVLGSILLVFPVSTETYQFLCLGLV